MIGNFKDGTVPGKMQYGAAWWFLDQKDGMEAQFRALSNMGLLSRFVGMITDSRSFLSYSRHDYFRRLLCNLLGEDVRRGLLPDDRDALGKLVGASRFTNARDYFGFPLGTAAGEHARRRAKPSLPRIGLRGLHERDCALERLESATQQDLAFRQIGPLLALRPEHEVVVAVLVDVHPNRLARLLERVVERLRHPLQPVLGADQDQERRLDRCDVRFDHCRVGLQCLEVGPRRGGGQLHAEEPDRRRRAEHGGVQRGHLREQEHRQGCRRGSRRRG